MGARQNISKSINTLKTSKPAWLPNSLSSTPSETLHKKLEEILNETTISSNDQLSSDIDYLIPYTFRVLMPEKCTQTNNAKSPPFFMQLDHTLAVLWHVFAHKDKERKQHIGIGQLQWALYFLKGIKDPLEGTRQADIDVAIKAIEDTLIECYAEMANVVMKKPVIKIKSNESNISELSAPKPAAKIGTSASLGILINPRTNSCKAQDFNVSSLSYTSFDVKPEVSTTLEELIKFRNATQEKKLTFCPIKNDSVTSNKIKVVNKNVKENDAYKMLKSLREDQVRKLNIEIENLRRMEEAASVRTYLKIILQYCQSFKIWRILYRIAVITIRLFIDQFRMDDIFVD